MSVLRGIPDMVHVPLRAARASEFLCRNVSRF